jgi:hypothetical protein
MIMQARKRDPRQSVNAKCCVTPQLNVLIEDGSRAWEI